MTWFSANLMPESGRKIAAIYSDGSGVVMLWRHDDGFIDADGDDASEEWWDEQIGLWSYLPDDLEFWCEIRAEDPFHFTLSPEHLAAKARRATALSELAAQDAELIEEPDPDLLRDDAHERRRIMKEFPDEE